MTQQPINGIAETMFHGEGAIAQCGHCKRYTLDRKALADSRQPVCDCGKQNYWSGSFKPPGPDAQWFGPAPVEQAEPSVLAPLIRAQSEAVEKAAPEQGCALLDEFLADAGITHLSAQQAAQPAAGEPVAWRDHVEHRLRTWRQQTMNRSGDRLALDDFMGQDDIDELIDYVCDEWAEPAAPAPVVLAASACCPVCGVDHPHAHTQKQVAHWLQAQAARFHMGSAIEVMTRWEADDLRQYKEAVDENNRRHVAEAYADVSANPALIPAATAPVGMAPLTEERMRDEWLRAGFSGAFYYEAREFLRRCGVDVEPTTNGIKAGEDVAK